MQLYLDSTNYLELTNLTDRDTGLLSSGAEITATLSDEDGEVVYTCPVPRIAAGHYRATVDPSSLEDLVEDNIYTVSFLIEDGPLVTTQQSQVVAQYLTCV